MGRGDGSTRLVSSPDADDRDTGILHVDMDAFYASVAVLDDPSLHGKPVIVGAAEGRSVVSSASYEARRFGVRSAMAVSHALRLCPNAVVVSPRMSRFREVSRDVMRIFTDFTPLVEALSIDEAFLDVRGAGRIWGSPGRIGALIRERVASDVGITCSVGVARTKHVAKMASTLAKPDGILIVPAAATQRFLDPRSVRAIWGVGPRTGDVLERFGIRTINDLRTTPTGVLERAVGTASARRLAALARGEDSREVEVDRAEKSMSHEETFTQDVSDPDVIVRELLRLADRVAARLRRAGLTAQGVAIKVRFDDFATVSRSTTLAEPSALGWRIGEAVRALLGEVDQTRPVRLVGVRAERLTRGDGAHFGLWDDDADWKRAEAALDTAVARFGDGAVTRAATLGRQTRAGVPGTDRPGLDSD